MMVCDQDRCEWVNVSSGTAHLDSPGQRAVKQLLLFCCCFEAVYGRNSSI